MGLPESHTAEIAEVEGATGGTEGFKDALHDCEGGSIAMLNLRYLGFANADNYYHSFMRFPADGIMAFTSGFRIGYAF